MAEPVIERLTLVAMLTAIEELQSVPGADSPRIIQDQFNFQQQFTPSTTVPFSRPSYQQVTVAGGVADFDLTALVSTQSNIDGTGKKLQVVYVKNNSTSNTMTFGPGSATKYHPFGTDVAVTIRPGGFILMYFADSLADVSGSVKLLRLTGTNGDTADVALILG